MQPSILLLRQRRWQRRRQKQCTQKLRWKKWQKTEQRRHQEEHPVLGARAWGLPYLKVINCGFLGIS